MIHQMDWRNAAAMDPRQYRQYGYEETFLVADIPAQALMDLMDVLDVNNNWRRFAAALDYTLTDIERFSMSLQRIHGSPTKCILIDWFGRKPTVRDLYYALTRIRLVSALQIIEKYLPSDLARQQRTTDYRQTGHNPYEHQAPVPPDAYNQREPYPRPPMFPNGYQPQHQQPVDMNSRPIPGPYPGALGHPSYHYRAANQQLGQQFFHPYSPNQYTSNPPYGGHSNVRQYQGVNEYKQLDEFQGYYPREAEESLESTKYHSGMPHSRPGAGPSIDFRARDVRNEVLRRTTRYDYAEVERATENFNSRNIVGEGGFGTVYRGKIQNKDMAIKVMKKGLVNSLDAFVTELTNLQLYSHENIIPLNGICIGGQKNCVLHKFMLNGSLEDRLQCKDGTAPIHWRKRHRILLGASRGLTFLHTSGETPLIHGDIKSANILLDEDFEPKLSDFGQARQATQSTFTDGHTHFILDQKDNYPLTEAYLPDEIFMNNAVSLGIKTDTFSFGVVIFETCSGLRPVDPRRGHDDRLLKSYVLNMAEEGRARPLLKEKDTKAQDWQDDLFLNMVDLSVRCASQKSAKRPSMKQVLSELEDMDRRAECFIEDSRPPPLGASDNSSSSRSDNQDQFSEITRSFLMKFSSDGGSLSNMNFNPPSMSQSSVDHNLVQRMYRAAGRTESTIDPRYLISDEKKLSAMERFDNDQGKSNVQNRFSAPPPPSPPAPNIGCDSTSDKPIPAARSQTLRSRNVPTQSSESDDRQSSSLPNQSSDIPTDEFGRMSIGQISMPMQLQREYDLRNASNEDNLPKGPPIHEPDHSPVDSDGLRRNTESTYKAEYEHRKKLQKKSLDFLALVSSAGGCSLSSSTSSDNNTTVPETLDKHSEEENGLSAPGCTAECNDDAFVPQVPHLKDPAPDESQEFQGDKPDLIGQEKNIETPVLHRREQRPLQGAQIPETSVSSVLKPEGSPTTIQDLKAPTSGDLGSVPPFDHLMCDPPSSGAHVLPESGDVPSTWDEPCVRNIVEPILEDQERILNYMGNRERHRKVMSE